MPAHAFWGLLWGCLLGLYRAKNGQSWRYLKITYGYIQSCCSKYETQPTALKKSQLVVVETVAILIAIVSKPQALNPSAKKNCRQGSKGLSSVIFGSGQTSNTQRSGSQTRPASASAVDLGFRVQGESLGSVDLSPPRNTGDMYEYLKGHRGFVTRLVITATGHVITQLSPLLTYFRKSPDSKP